MKQLYRAENDRERAIALASLPEAGLIATIEVHAKGASKGNAEALLWMDTLVRHGFLEMRDSIAWDPTVSSGRGMNNAANEVFIDARKNRFHALMLFAKDFESVFEDHHDPIYGELERSTVRFRLPVHPGFARIFAEACDRLVTDDQAFFEIAQPSQQSQDDQVVRYHGLASSHWLERQETFSRAMGVACMLGLPEQVKSLAMQCPHAMTYPMELKEFLGNHPLLVHAKLDVSITPYFCALQFSQPACIDALVAAGMPGDCHLTALSIADEKTREFTRHNVERFLRLGMVGCAPSTLAKALRLNEEAGGYQDVNMQSYIAGALEGKYATRLDAYLPAFLETGRLHLDRNPTDLMHSACAQGFPSLVKAMEAAGTIPWGQLGHMHTEPFSNEERRAPDSQIVAHASLKTKLYSPRVRIKIEEAVMALFDAAERAGKDKVAGLMAPYRSETGTPDDPKSLPLFEPIDSVLQAPFKKVLVRMMQHGLDPQATYETITHRTPIEKAMEMNCEELAHTMRTFVNHQRAQNALRELDEMLNEPESPRP